jgi:hypothetical protein
MKEKRIIIRLFGKFEILIDGELVLENINQSKKTRDFLAYLILHKDKRLRIRNCLRTYGWTMKTRIRKCFADIIVPLSEDAGRKRHR